MNRNSKANKKSALPMRVIKNRKTIIQNKVFNENEAQQTIMQVT